MIVRTALHSFTVGNTKGSIMRQEDILLLKEFCFCLKRSLRRLVIKEDIRKNKYSREEWPQH